MKKSILIMMLFCLPVTAMAFRVVGNFENSMDGWVLENGATAVYSSEWVTNGSKSLELTVKPNWITSMRKDLMSVADQMKVAETITLDITTRNDGGQIPPWWLQIMFVINTNNGWVESPNLFGGVPWSPRTDTLSMAVPESIRQGFNNGTITFCEFIIITNTGEPHAKFWVDNVRLNWPVSAAYSPTPEDQSFPEPASVTSLGWFNLEGIGRNDVYFGTDVPNPADANETWRNQLTLIATIDAPLQEESVAIPAQFLPLQGDVTYYWIVDSYNGSPLPEEPNVPGFVWEFTPVSNTAPVFTLGPDQYHWLGQGGTPGEVTVTLDPAVTDDGKPNPPGVLTYKWKKINSFRVDDLVFPITTSTLTLPFTVPGRYEFELTVDDGDKIAKDSIYIYVGTDACDTYRRTPNAAYFKSGDLDHDCSVDMADLQLLAANWLNCSDFLTDCN
jgi:hypothetical protein